MREQLEKRLAELRAELESGQRALADACGVTFTYISKIENHRLGFGDYPSEEVIEKIAVCAVAACALLAVVEDFQDVVHGFLARGRAVARHAGHAGKSAMARQTRTPRGGVADSQPGKR